MNKRRGPPSERVKAAQAATMVLDEIMFVLAQDEEMAEDFYPFSPFFNLLSFSEPYKFSNAASMTDSIIASTSEWLSQQKRKATA